MGECMTLKHAAVVMGILVAGGVSAAGQPQVQPVDVTTLGPQAGQKAIEFRLPDQVGREHTLASLAGPKGTMLVFSRSAAWCPYCRSQMVELQRELATIRQQGYGVAVITYDSADVLKEFADKYGVTYPLLSDAGSKTITAWGLLNKEATGRSAGIPHPGTFVIDRSGVVVSRAFEQAYQERRSAASLLAEVSGTPARPISTVRGSHATVELSVSDPVAVLGHRITLSARVTPAPRNHVYAPGQKGYIPVSLTLKDSSGYKSHPARFPSSTTYLFEPLNETVQVYSAPFTITQDVTVALTADARARAAKGEALSIEGELEYQACDDKVCHRPETLPVVWTVTLSPIIR